MEILTILILLLIVYLIVSHKTDTNRKLSDLDNKVSQLKRLAEQLQSKSATEEPVVKTTDEHKPVISETPSAIPPETVSKPEPPKPAETQPLPEQLKPENIERRPEVITDSLSAIRRPIKTTADFTSPKP